MAALERHRVRFVIYNPVRQSHMQDLDFQLQPLLADYLNRHYKPAFPIGQYMVFQRDDI